MAIGDASRLLGTLADRERQLLVLASRPMSAKEIAIETGLTVGTVNNYLSNAQRRLGARNRVEAIRLFKAYTDQDPIKVHMNFPQVFEPRSTMSSAASKTQTPHGLIGSGLADSIAPRSRSSLEAFLGSSNPDVSKLPNPGQLDRKKRLYAILALATVITFLMASVVILLDALTRLVTTT